MANYPQTGSLLTRNNSPLNDPGAGLEGVSGSGNNRTGMSLSTMILIQVGDTTVGAIQELSVTERRDIRKLAEVGTDGIIDSAPNKATEISGSCQRIRFDRLRAAEAFGRAWTHVHAQRIPFDITITDYFGFDSNQDATIVTVLKNVWVSEISYAYSASDYIITDRMNFQAESIYSQLLTGGNNIATGGARNLTVYGDSIERDADIGLRRGSLDAPGLLNAVYSAF
jgi:hypothetical protein